MRFPMVDTQSVTFSCNACHHLVCVVLVSYQIKFSLHGLIRTHYHLLHLVFNCSGALIKLHSGMSQLLCVRLEVCWTGLWVWSCCCCFKKIFHNSGVMDSVIIHILWCHAFKPRSIFWNTDDLFVQFLCGSWNVCDTWRKSLVHWKCCLKWHGS